MKKYKKKSIFAITLSVLALAGCSDEFSGIPNETTEESSGSTITVEEAMDYFDDHIKTFHLSPQGKTRRADEELLAAPEWEDGKAIATISSNQIYDVNNPMQVSEKQTRSLEYQCWTEYIWVDEYRYYNTEWGVEMGEEEHCDWSGGHMEEEYVCDYVEVDDVCGACHNDPCTCDQDNDKDDNTGEWGDNDNPNNPNDDIIWSGDNELDDLKKEMLKLGFNINKVKFKRDQGLSCKAYAQANKDGSISFCPQFENLELCDKIPITAHECYHYTNGHCNTITEQQTLDETEYLPNPPDNIKQYLLNTFEKEAEEIGIDKSLIESYKEREYRTRLMINSIASPSYNRNEIETYEYEMKKFPNVTPEYQLLREFKLWEYKQLYELAKNIIKNKVS